MPITNYDLAIDREYSPGALITASGGKVHGRFNTTGGILYHGLGVVRGSNYREVALPAADGDVFEGVVKMTITYEIRDGYTRDPITGMIGYPADREVSIIRPGDLAQIAVWVDSATAYDDPVYLRYSATAGVTGIVGCFRNDAGTATASLANGARFIKTVEAPAAGSMVISHIELT